MMTKEEFVAEAKRRGLPKEEVFAKLQQLEAQGKFAASPDTSPSDTGVPAGESYLGGVARRVGEVDYGGIAGEFIPELNRRLEPYATTGADGQTTLPAGITTMETLSQLGRTGGEFVSSTIGALIPDFIRRAAGDAWDELSNTETGQEALLAIASGFEAWNNWEKTNPTAAKYVNELFSSVGTGLDVATLFSPRPDLLDFDKQAKKATAAATKSDLSNRKKAMTGMLEPEFLGTRDKETIGLLGSSYWFPQDFEDTMIEAVLTIPGIQPYGSVRKNFRVIQDHIETQGKKLDNYIKSQNKKINMDDLENEFLKVANDFAASDAYQLASKSAKTAIDNYMELARKIIKEEGTDLKGLLKARRRFDKAVTDAGKSLDADVSTYQTLAAKEVRNLMNEYLKRNTKGDEVHHLLDQQFRSLTALDRLVNKRNAEAKNVPGRLVQSIKDNTGISLSTSLLSVLATGAYVLEPVAGVALGGTAVATALSSQIKRHGKATVLKAYAELLSGTNKAIKVVSDPTKLEALELDRLVLIDMIDDIRSGKEDPKDG